MYIDKQFWYHIKALKKPSQKKEKNQFFGQWRPSWITKWPPKLRFLSESPPRFSQSSFDIDKHVIAHFKGNFILSAMTESFF